jgi:hypothetical protein
MINVIRNAFTLMPSTGFPRADGFNGRTGYVSANARIRSHHLQYFVEKQPHNTNLLSLCPSRRPLHGSIVIESFDDHY